MIKQLLTDSKTKLSSFVGGAPWKRSKMSNPVVNSRSLLSEERFEKLVPKSRLFGRQTDVAGRPKFGKPQDADLRLIERSDNNAVQNSLRSRRKNEKYKEGKRYIESNVTELCHKTKRLNKRQECSSINKKVNDLKKRCRDRPILRHIESNITELCHKTKRLDKWEECSSINKKDNDLKKRCMDRPILSDVQSSNFRIRLYCQLNVVQSRSKKLSVNTRGVHSNPPRFFSLNRKHERGVHRSMPVTIDIGPFFDRYDGYVERVWAEHSRCHSSESLDADDIFTLDI